MKLQKKILALTNNIFLCDSYLYYTDLDRKVTCIDINDYSTIWFGLPDRFSLKFSRDFVYNSWDYIDKRSVIVNTQILDRKSGEELYKVSFNPTLQYKNNIMFFYHIEPYFRGLFDFDNKELLWKNDREIPDNVFIKGDHFYTLQDMRLEKIEAMTGKLEWSVSTKIDNKYDRDPQNIIDVIDDHLVMTYGYQSISGLDIETGRIAWEWDINELNDIYKQFIFPRKENIFLKASHGKYYFAGGRRLLKFDIVNREIEHIVDTEIVIRGSKKQVMFHDLFLCGDKMCFYGMDYSKRLHASYSTIGIFDMEQEKVVDFADDEFPGPLSFKPIIYGNRLFQQDDDGNIHIFELELEN